MAGTGPTDLFEMADEFLQAGVAALDTLLTLGFDGAPSIAFVAPGEPAADCCPQLTVHVVGVEEAPTEPTGPGGLAQGRRASYGRISQPSFVMTLFRCVPAPEMKLTAITPPSAAAQQSVAEQLDADGWALWNHLYNLVRAQLLWSKCQGIFPGPLRALPNSGGCGGWVLGYRVRLDGYEEVLP